MFTGVKRYFAEHIFANLAKYLGFLQPVVELIERNGGVILTTAAEQAVKAVAADPSIIEDADKRSAATQMILRSMRSSARDLEKAAINAAIELAVAKIKAQ